MQIQTGWPRHANMIPPIAADTITTTMSEMSLQNNKFWLQEKKIATKLYELDVKFTD